MAGVGKGDIRAKLTLTPSPAELARIFNRAGEEMVDFRPAFRQMVPFLAGGLRKVIQSEGAGTESFSTSSGISGGKWPRPKASYARRKLREGHGAKPLVRSGWFMVAVMTALSARSSGHIGKRSVSVGFRGALAADRAVPLQFKRGYVMVAWTQQMQADAQRVMAEYIDSILRRLADATNKPAPGVA